MEVIADTKQDLNKVVIAKKKALEKRMKEWKQKIGQYVKKEATEK